MFRKDLKVFVRKEDNWYVAKSADVGVASQEKTRKEALKNFQEAIELLFEDEKYIRSSKCQ